MTKAAFEVVALAVEQVYASNPPEEEFDQLSKLVEAIITGAGWSLDEFMERALREDNADQN